MTTAAVWSETRLRRCLRMRPRASAVRSLVKRFGTLEVFSGVDFDVGEREIVTIVGPSGCGKTTLLRCIDGLLPVDGGEILCDGVR